MPEFGGALAPEGVEVEVKYDRPVWQLMHACADAMPEVFTYADVRSWFDEHYPEVGEATIRAHVVGLTEGGAKHPQFQRRSPLFRRVARGQYTPIPFEDRGELPQDEQPAEAEVTDETVDEQDAPISDPRTDAEIEQFVADAIADVPAPAAADADDDEVEAQPPTVDPHADIEFWPSAPASDLEEAAEARRKKRAKAAKKRRKRARRVAEARADEARRAMAAELAEAAASVPVEPVPVEPEPIESEPIESEPIESEAVEPEPIESEAVEPEPDLKPEPVDVEPVEPVALEPDVDPEPTPAPSAADEPAVDWRAEIEAERARLAEEAAHHRDAALAEIEAERRRLRAEREEMARVAAERAEERRQAQEDIEAERARIVAARAEAQRMLVEQQNARRAEQQEVLRRESRRTAEVVQEVERLRVQREEAERLAETERRRARKLRKVARKQRETADALDRELAERKARKKAERRARENAERHLHEAAERRRLEESERQSAAATVRQELARLEAEAMARIDAERSVRERSDRERADREREAGARERAEQDRLARERAERERLAFEREQRERERDAFERAERERREWEQRDRADQAERERREREQLEREEEQLRWSLRPMLDETDPDDRPFEWAGDPEPADPDTYPPSGVVIVRSPRENRPIDPVRPEPAQSEPDRPVEPEIRADDVAPDPPAPEVPAVDLPTPDLSGSDVVIIGSVGERMTVPVPAKDAYRDLPFQRARRDAERSGLPWYVLSAEHGLLEPHEWISPDDRAITDIEPRHSLAWAAWVAARLETLRGSLDGVRVQLLVPEQVHDVLFETVTAAGATTTAAEELDEPADDGSEASTADAEDPESGAETVDPVEDDGVARVIPFQRIGSVAEQLSDERFSVSASATASLPNQQGIYAWSVDHAGSRLLNRALRLPVRAGIVFVGQVGAHDASFSGLRDQATGLADHVSRLQLHGRSRESTFRGILAATLSDVLGLHGADDPRLTRWMLEHLSVTVWTTDDLRRLQQLTSSVVEELRPPLNLEHTRAAEYRRRVSELRRGLA